MSPRRLAVVLVLAVAAACSGPGSGRDQAPNGTRPGGGPATTADPTPANVTTTTAAGQTTAAAVIADLRAHGFKVTGAKEVPVELSGAREAWDCRINGVEAGVLVFPDTEAAQGYAELGESFGAISVVGDTWAVNLDSDESGGTPKAQSRRLARRIAAEVGGAVR